MRREQEKKTKTCHCLHGEHSCVQQLACTHARAHTQLQRSLSWWRFAHTSSFFFFLIPRLTQNNYKSIKKYIYIFTSKTRKGKNIKFLLSPFFSLNITNNRERLFFYLYYICIYIIARVWIVFPIFTITFWLNYFNIFNVFFFTIVLNNTTIVFYRIVRYILFQKQK